MQTSQRSPPAKLSENSSSTLFWTLPVVSYSSRCAHRSLLSKRSISHRI